MDNHIFRSAIGGFNRQDVMEYIERVQKQAEDASAALEAQTQQLRRAHDETLLQLEERTRERDGLEQQLEEMTLRCNHARNNWDAQSQAKESFRRDVAQRDEAIRGMTEENQRLLRQVEALESQMDGLRREKEQLTQLELDARQRAENVLAQANAQAEAALAQAQAQAESIIAQAQAQAEATASRANARADALLRETETRIGETVQQYEELYRSLQSITGHIAGEARKLGTAAAQLPAGFNRLRDGLADLQRRAKEQ